MKPAYREKQGAPELHTFRDSDLAEIPSDKEILRTLMGEGSTFTAHTDSFNQLWDTQPS